MTTTSDYYSQYAASYPEQLWIISVALSLLNAFLCGLATLALRLSWIMVLPPPDEQPLYHPNNNVLVLPTDNDNDMEPLMNTPENATLSYQDELALVSNGGGNDITCEEIQPLSTETGTTTLPLNTTPAAAVYSDDDTAAPTSCNNSTPPPYYCAWTIRGAALLQFTLITPVLDMVAVYFASPSIVTPSSGVALACVVLLAQPVLGERQDAIRVVGACLILWGELLVAAFGDHVSNDQETIQQVMDSYSEPNFVLFLGISTLLMLLLFSWIIRCSEDDYHNPGLERFAWGVSGGYLAGLQNFIKDALTIWKLYCADNNNTIIMPWRLPWVFWLLVTMAATTAAGGLALMTFCMKRYDATYTSGTFAGALVVSSSVMSAVHYHTFDHLPFGWLALFYPFGILTLLLGVFILAQCTDDEDDTNTNHSSIMDDNHRHTSTNTLTSDDGNNDIEASVRTTLMDPEMANAVPIRKYT